MTLLKVKSGCEFYAYGSERYVLHTSDQRHFLISSTTKELLEALIASKPLETICEDLAQGGDPALTVAELTDLLQTRFGHLGIFAAETAPLARSATARGSGLVNQAFLRCWDLLPSSRVERMAQRLAWLYGNPANFLAIALILATHVLVYNLRHGYFALRLNHGSPLAILFLALFSILAHELGHGTALLRFGARPGKIGFGLYFLMPAFFADVSQVWRLPRHARLTVDVGGVYFQQAVFVIYAAGALYWHSLEFAAACFAIDAMTVFALNPVFRFDGYWLLADWLALPNMHRDAVRLLKYWLGRLIPGRSGRVQGRPATLPRLSGVKATAFSAYAVFCNLFIAFALIFSARYLRSGLFSFAKRLPARISEIHFSASVGAWAIMTDQLVTTLVAFAFAATAVLGLCVYLVRALSLLRSSFRSISIPYFKSQAS